ncbi:MAG: N-methyl-D-aspartate receptor NMDAR2C subunit [Burkholderiales bacterium]
MSDLLLSWTRAWRGIGASGTGSRVYSELLASYGEPHRHYHTTQHLTECLDAFNFSLTLADRPAEVEMALWFHDAIYDVTRSDNEERSANWAKSELLSNGVSEQAAERVYSLVLMTRHSALPVSKDEKVLVDIDLSILGSKEDRFQEYERQIRAEYSFVPGFLFKRKRKAILKAFLERAAIYSTDHFVRLWEQRARTNLQRATDKNAA